MRTENANTKIARNVKLVFISKQQFSLSCSAKVKSFHQLENHHNRFVSVVCCEMFIVCRKCAGGMDFVRWVHGFQVDQRHLLCIVTNPNSRIHGKFWMHNYFEQTFQIWLKLQNRYDCVNSLQCIKLYESLVFSSENQIEMHIHRKGDCRKRQRVW